jgi:hypothetical protein
MNRNNVLMRSEDFKDLADDLARPERGTSNDNT